MITAWGLAPSASHSRNGNRVPSRVTNTPPSRCDVTLSFPTGARVTAHPIRVRLNKIAKWRITGLVSGLGSQVRSPIMDAESPLAKVPDTMARNANGTISARRSGIRALMPAMRMPTLPKLAKPHSA